MKDIILWLAVVVLVGAGVWYFTQKANAPDQQVQYTSEIFTFTEDGSNLDVQYNDTGEKAQVTYQGEQYELDTAISASGARYANEDDSVVFWEHQGEASLEVDGQMLVSAAQRETAASDEAPLQIPMILQNTSWQWEETQYENNPTVAPTEPNDFVLSFMDEWRFSATTDCNALMGDFTATDEDHSITFSAIAGTRMACPDESQEATFSQMLEQATSYRATDEAQLILSLTDDSGQMVFSATTTETDSASEEAADSGAHNAIIGMTTAEAEAYAEENNLTFRVGIVDGEGLPVTTDFVPGRITAETEDDIVISYSVEQE